jgi:hypothetical protein
VLQRRVTLVGMFAGVAASDAFQVLLARHYLESWKVLQALRR